MKNYRTLKTFNDSVEANLAKNYLQNQGIDAILTDEYVGEIFSNVVKGIKLEVNVDHFDKAAELLGSLPEIQEEEDGEEEDESEKKEVIEILEECRALKEGHFKLTSGLHSDRYIEKIGVIQYPEKVVTLCRKLSRKLEDTAPDVVVGIAMGGIVLGYEVARELGKMFVFSQRKEGKMTIRSGFKIEPGMKAIIIEDIVTTGGSVREVIELLQSLGLEVEAIGLLVDRSGGKADFKIRTESLLKVDITTYKPEECPLCEAGVPLSVPGSSDKR